MSDTQASLSRQMASANDLNSVIRSMKAIAASNMRHFNRAVHALADYDRTIRLGLSVSLRASELKPPRLSTNKKPTGVGFGLIIIGTDQGLVGQFNDEVVTAAFRLLTSHAGKPWIWSVGERLQALMSAAGLTVQQSFPVPISVSAISSLVEQILVDVESQHATGVLAHIYVLFNRSVTGARYAPISFPLLPLDASWWTGQSSMPWPTHNLPEIIGSNQTTLQALIHEHLFISLFRSVAESIASENASRLAAMERAEKNISEVLVDLRGTFNRLRKEAIDEELFDVLSGYEAMRAKRIRPDMGAGLHESTIASS